MKVVTKTQKNQRNTNEDSFVTDCCNGNLLLAVCDGMGGCKNGQLASNAACSSLLSLFRRGLYNFEKYIDSISQYVSKTEGGSTFVSAIFFQNVCRVEWLGDSRAYIFSQNRLTRLTKDNNLAGEFGPDYPRNVLTRYLGNPGNQRKNPKIEIVCKTNDIIFLCTDGAIGSLTDGQIAALLRKTGGSLENFSDLLFKSAESCGDNQTIVAIQL